MGSFDGSMPSADASRPPSAFRPKQGVATAPKRAAVKIGARGIPTVSGSKDFEDFVYILSHDIRASVRALSELPEWIRDDLTDDHVRIGEALSENLDLMQSHAKRLDQMLLDLLAYSRVGRKQSVRLVHIDSLLNTIIIALNVPPQFKISVDLGVKTLNIGEDDIETLLSALISNAIKHHNTDAGRIVISTRLEGTHCVLCVVDDGPGIPLTSRDRVMEAMTTLRSRDEVEGSGMGLAIVRKIVDLYDGRFEWLDVEVGTGIKITLPV